MADHIIEVLFVGTAVRAVPNPLPATGRAEVRPGETVTWVFDPAIELQAAFTFVLDLVTPGSVPVAINPLGPFSSLSVTRGRISGPIRSGVPETVTQSRRFFYRLFRDGAPLQWAPGVDLAPDQFAGGGIDIPRTPPPSSGSPTNSQS